MLCSLWPKHCCYLPVCQGKTTECPLQRWTPPTLCSSGWGSPPLSAWLGLQETAWHRKPHFLYGKKRKWRGGKNSATVGGRQWERSRWHRQQFFLPRWTRGNDFSLDQRSHSTIKKLFQVCSTQAYTISIHVTRYKSVKEIKMEWPSVRDKTKKARKLWAPASLCDM